MAIHLGRSLRGASCNQPRRLIWKGLTGLPVAPPLFGFAPGGVCRAASVARDAVRSYRTLSPLPTFALSGSAGGLLSVALSLGSPPPEVIRHRTSLEPGLSSPPNTQNMRAKRPSGLLTPVIRGLSTPPSSHWRSVPFTMSRPRSSRSLRRYAESKNPIPRSPRIAQTCEELPNLSHVESAQKHASTKSASRFRKAGTQGREQEELP
jgi:hypothetical protein